MENNVYSEVKLLALLKEKKLKGVRYGLAERYMDTKALVVYLDRLEDVLDVAMETKQPVIFYKYHYLEPKDLIIDDNALECLYDKIREKGLEKQLEKELEERLDEKLYNEIESYNRKVIDVDFKQPVGLSVFCLYEGNRILYEGMDFRILDENHLRLFPEKALGEIMLTSTLKEASYQYSEDDDILN